MGLNNLQSDTRQEHLDHRIAYMAQMQVGVRPFSYCVTEGCIRCTNLYPLSLLIHHNFVLMGFVLKIGWGIRWLNYLALLFSGCG
jgi:hypothetical protein